ncbi:hypothetical protein D9M70_559340 [compost metagenome]
MVVTSLNNSATSRGCPLPNPLPQAGEGALRAMGSGERFLYGANSFANQAAGVTRGVLAGLAALSPRPLPQAGEGAARAMGSGERFLCRSEFIREAGRRPAHDITAPAPPRAGAGA